MLAGRTTSMRTTLKPDLHLGSPWGARVTALLGALLPCACSVDAARAPDVVAEHAQPPPADQPAELAPAAAEAPPPDPVGEDDPSTWVELAHASCSSTTAIWLGVREPVMDNGIAPPIEYGFRELVFRLGDGTEKTFEPLGVLFFSDWQRSIFSPDCAHVVLLQDRFGPFHVVSLERLRDYLDGRAAPDHVVEGCSSCSSAAVHADARWLDADTLTYTVGACGTESSERFELGERSKPGCRELD